MKAAKSHSDASDLSGLLDLKRDELMAVFLSLPAPPLDNLNGSYSGHLPVEIEQDWRRFVAKSGAGQWLGKTFSDLEKARAPRQGHNRYLIDGEIKSGLRFDLVEGMSRFDDRPSVLLLYGPHRNWAGEQDLTDELRAYMPGVLLGLYHTRSPVPGFTPRADRDRSAPEFFVLTAPNEETYAST